MTWTKQKYIGLGIASAIMMVPLVWFTTGQPAYHDFALHNSGAAATGYLIGFFGAVIILAPLAGWSWVVLCEVMVKYLRRLPWQTAGVLVALSAEMIVGHALDGWFYLIGVLMLGGVILGVWHLLKLIGLAPAEPVDTTGLQEVFE
jgi:hypothetical protein